MYKVIVFAGTTEGYQISRFLASHQVSVYACVATEYGSRSLEEGPYLHVAAGRLDPTEMEELFRQEKPELVLDATHPYAAAVTENIRLACQMTGMEYVRVLRENGQGKGQTVYVENIREAVSYLAETTGNILLTTGSKELSEFTALPDYRNRIYARVLSLTSVLETCRELGLEGKHLIGMQGPFSRELNAAMLRQYQCEYLVTKDTGNAGGFREKMEAAAECGVTAVIIGRPLKETGLSLRECRKLLAERFGFSIRPEVSLLGIGMGSRENLTVEGKNVLEDSELLIGARRIVDAVRLPGQEVYYEYRSSEIVSYIQNHPEYEKITVVLSGDVGFYSGAKKLLPLLGEQTRVICGISSVVYFMSKIGLSWDDAKIVSAHGRACNLISLIGHHEKVFAILGTSDGVSVLSRKLVEYGMGSVILWVGERLSGEDEKIFQKEARELTDYEGDPLSVVCACNPAALPEDATHGKKDEEFIRGKAPMTKEEVRAVSLAKLRLNPDSICYDVGAGTGSVAIEMALRAWQGKVYAIEKKEEAAALIQENRKKFRTDNLEVICGEAPEAMRELPVPTHAFVGGSSGNLKEIVFLLLEKNRNVRIVINCITLETISEVLQILKEFRFLSREVVQMSVSRAKELGSYHLLMGENPIYIITCQYPAEE